MKSPLRPLVVAAPARPFRAASAPAFVAALVVVLSKLAAAAAGTQPVDWQVDYPKGAKVQQVADDLVLNGRHSHVARLTLSGSEDEVLNFYRERFGKLHVENTVRTSRVIASRQGDCFVTVSVHPTLAGQVEATVMSTRFGGARERSKAETDTESALPAGSQVLNTQESVDGGLRSLLLTAANRAGVQANRDALLQSLQAKGFHVDKESAGMVKGHASVAMSFASAAEDATVTIADAGAYRAVVIQRTRRSP